MIALTILMNEFLVKVQNSSMERRNRALKSFSGHALLCPGHAYCVPVMRYCVPVMRYCVPVMDFHIFVRKNINGDQLNGHIP